MGVPSFFRWVSLRYQRGRKTAESDLTCDNLYLDMNGIIHPCFHPESGPQPESEDEVFVAIIARIEMLIAAAKQHLAYLAVDGPAPRAKMNQQRARRFRAAHDAERSRKLDAQLRERFAREGRTDAPPPKAARMDPNVITPGTAFMAKLGRWLRHWAHTHLNGINDDGSEGTIPPYRIVLSDASVPGEGEHKAVAFIRAQRHAAGYEPTRSHVIHGLDADLIMLALATHEPRFTILRDAQRKGKRVSTAGGSRDDPPYHAFELVKIDTLREYLERDLRDADWTGVRNGFDLERAIDDFIFLCFFVGNDFLPSMPGMEIKQGAIEALLLLYKGCVSSRMHGYLTNNGDVNLQRLGALLQMLSKLEQQLLRAKGQSEAIDRQRREESQRQKALNLQMKNDQHSIVEEDESSSHGYRGQASIQKSENAGGGGGGGGAAASQSGGHGMGAPPMGRAARVLARIHGDKAPAPPAPPQAGQKRPREEGRRRRRRRWTVGVWVASQRTTPRWQQQRRSRRKRMTRRKRTWMEAPWRPRRRLLLLPQPPQPHRLHRRHRRRRNRNRRSVK